MKDSTTNGDPWGFKALLRNGLASQSNPDKDKTSIFEDIAAMGSRVSRSSADMSGDGDLWGFRRHGQPNLPTNDMPTVFGNPDADVWQVSPLGGAVALKAPRAAGGLEIPGADVERFVPNAVKAARALKDYAVQSQFKA